MGLEDVFVGEKPTAEVASVHVVPRVHVHVHPDVVPARVGLVADEADVL